MGISVCMIVRDGGKTLERALSSIRSIASEIIIVDTGSTDNTIEIAEKFNAEIVSIKWRDDFSYARNVGVRLASEQWVMWLDADDEVSPDSIQALFDIKAQVPDHCYSFICETVNPCVPWDESAKVETTFCQARMFPNFRGIKFEGRIHEKFAASATATKIGIVHRPDIKILHHGYQDANQFREKFRRNMGYILAEKFCNNKNDFIKFDSSNKKYMCFYSQQYAKNFICKGRANIAVIDFADAFEGTNLSFEEIAATTQSAIDWIETHPLTNQLIEFKAGGKTETSPMGNLMSAIDTINAVDAQIMKELN